MQPLRHASRRRPSYVCLSCRLHSQSHHPFGSNAEEEEQVVASAESGHVFPRPLRRNDSHASQDTPSPRKLSHTTEPPPDAFRRVKTESQWGQWGRAVPSFKIRRLKTLRIRKHDLGLGFVKTIARDTAYDEPFINEQKQGEVKPVVGTHESGALNGNPTFGVRQSSRLSDRKLVRKQWSRPGHVREEQSKDELIGELIGRHVELGERMSVVGRDEGTEIGGEELLERKRRGIDVDMEHLSQEELMPQAGQVGVNKERWDFKHGRASAASHQQQQDEVYDNSQAGATIHDPSNIQINVRPESQTYQPSRPSTEADHTSPSIIRNTPYSSGSSTLRNIPLTSTSSNGHHARFFHAQRRISQQAAATTVPSDLEQLPPPSPSPQTQIFKEGSIREQLRQWQAQYGNIEDPTDSLTQDSDTYNTGPMNNFTRLPNDQNALLRPDLEEEEEEGGHEAFNQIMRSQTQDLDDAASDTRFLHPGELVEIEYGSERESIIGIFIRRIGTKALVFNMSGRWVVLPERWIQFSVPGWVSPDAITPILPYLPDPQSLLELEEVYKHGAERDLSIPREASAGLVSRMVQFHTESQEIYRRHASALDNAHEVLAHDTDLRYGSLAAAATTLLKIPVKELSMTALFTVRKALSRTQFAFSIDRRSHRTTGYMQIRSKEQVKMVQEVKGWLRDWQDDVVARSAIEAEEDVERRRSLLKKHRTPKTAQYVYDFVEKARKIILKSREDREPTPYGCVGPSKRSFPITPTSGSVRITTDTQFAPEDTQLVKFMEGWGSVNLFHSEPRLQALPPMILQAIGLYKDFDMIPATGHMFLQELGTILPYENRVRFDTNLLLPSSQHSRPLQKLMSTIMRMDKEHQFVDSMEDIRHDWKDLAVYCIDAASAHEIDDGISIERAGKNEWWVHIHIANPTAFFQRDHALAKMARHMGESVYMPERTYLLMPRWATQAHFSLENKRPCLTFSARMDAEGNTLENKIQPGIVRNVFHLTHDEVRRALGTAEDQRDKLVLTVGGEPPPEPDRKSRFGSLTKQRREELRVLKMLAEKRGDIRKKAGGIFFNIHRPESSVWQRWGGPGLAWDHPHRDGARRVEGDPVIRLQTEGLANWFAPREKTVEVLVQEMMLLTSEIAGKWCAERRIPGLFRGTIRRPEHKDPQRFLHEVVIPAAEKAPDGAYPLHLGIQYLSTIGNVVMRTEPFPHAMLGMNDYTKVTSPLRRYGDMIMHWQIEAALREEARTGQSLTSPNASPDRSFLPFSASALNAIGVSLQPRERLVMDAKRYAEEFWATMLVFRAAHFGETELPFHTLNAPTFPDGSTKPLMRVFLHSLTAWNVNLEGVNVELDIQARMTRPDKLGLEEAFAGDTWECNFDHADVHGRGMYVTPVRLVHRPEFAKPIN